MLDVIHNGTGRGDFGFKKTLAKVRDCFYWTRCIGTVEDWCRKCTKSLLLRDRRQKVEDVCVGTSFEIIELDVAGSFLVTDRHFLVLMNYYSKWPKGFYHS